MIKFKPSDIKLVNALWEFLGTQEGYDLVEDMTSIEDTKYLAGWLVYELENVGNLDLEKWFHDLDLFEQAIYVKKGVEKYEIQ